MGGLTRALAILCLLAGIALTFAPALDTTGHSASALPGGITVTATVRALAIPPHPPLAGLQASAQGYIIAISWTNPAAPYSGTLIEWYTDHAHRGTGFDSAWHEYETYYPPATWARVSAPMGARYSLRGSAYYDGGTTMSVPAEASVVITAPVDLSISCPSTGYAASPALSRRYGETTYRRRFVIQIGVPGDGANNSMGSNPISWSPQLRAAPAIKVYRLQPKKVRLRRPGGARGYYWSTASTGRAATTRYWGLMRSVQAAFADGYPAGCSYPLTSTVPGAYKLVMEGEFAEGFAIGGVRSWKATRYITLAPTRFGVKLTAPRVQKNPRHGKKIAFSATLSPRRAATIRVSIQRRLRGRWKNYKTLNVKSKVTGIWTARILVKKAGSFRVRTTVAGTIVDRYREYASAVSAWRAFKVR